MQEVIRKIHPGMLLATWVSLRISQIQKPVASWYLLPSLMLSEIDFTSARFKQEWPIGLSAVNI